MDQKWNIAELYTGEIPTEYIDQTCIRPQINQILLVQVQKV